MLLQFYNPADYAYKKYIYKGPAIQSYKELFVEIMHLLHYFPPNNAMWTMCFSPILPFHNITDVERSRIHVEHEVRLSSLKWSVFEFYSLQKVCCEINAKLGLEKDSTLALKDCFIPLIDSGFFGKIYFSQPVEDIAFLNELRNHVQSMNINHENLYV
jgi:hypothetical protein